MLDTDDEWKQIKENFPNQTGAAYCKSNTLHCALLDPNINTSDVLSFPNPKINWKYSQEWVKHHLHRQLNTHKFSEVEKIKAYGPEKSNNLVPTPTSCLYQMKSILNSDWGWFRRVGIATREAREGDMICWLRSTEKLVVVRLEDDFLRIVGTAMTPENRFGFQSGNEIELCLDVETAYILPTSDADQD
jgi:hypothetical protein